LRRSIFLQCKKSEVWTMFTDVQDFFAEQMKTFGDRAPRFDGEPTAAMRQGLDYSVEAIKSFEKPVRVAARSSVELAAVSHKAMRDLIELQTDMVTAALTEMAESLERVAEANDPGSLIGAQLDAVRASAERLVSDANRATEIFTDAGNSVQKVAADAYEAVALRAKAAPAAAEAAPASGKRRASRKAAA